jgi:hypothetical protein
MPKGLVASADANFQVHFQPYSEIGQEKIRIATSVVKQRKW